MRRYAACVEYDGGAFAGWQVQQGLRTVEAELVASLTAVAAHPVDLICAGRTDAGVHASGQLVHFESDAVRSLRAWTLGANSNLPPDISLQWVRSVPEHFHARYSAISRTYRYLICNRSTRAALARGRAALVYPPLDVAAMQAAAARLVGEHDFSAFRAAGCQSRSPVRRLERLDVDEHVPVGQGTHAAADLAGRWIVVTATANAFLHHMVRNLVGLLIAVGRGDAQPDWAAEVLASRDRRVGAPTAPAEGLYLASVAYPPAFGLPPPAGAGSAGSAMIPALAI